MVSVVPGSGANSRVWKRDIEHAVVVDDIGHMNIPELDKDLTLFKNQKLICQLNQMMHMQQPKFGQAQQYYQSHQGYSQHPQQYQQYYQNQGQQLANINQKQQQSQQGIPQQQKHMNNLNGANPINPTSYMHSPIAPPSPPIATDVAASQNSSNPLAAGQQQPPQSSNTPPYQQTTIIQNQMNAQNVQMNAHNFNNCNITIMCIHLKNLVGNQFGSSGSATNTASSVGLGTPPSAQQANGSALGGSGMGPNSVPINSNQNLGSMPSVNNSTHSTQSPIVNMTPMTEMTHAAAEMTTDFTELPTAIEKPMKLFRGILHKLVGKKENTR